MKRMYLVIGIIILGAVLGGTRLFPVDFGVKSGMSIVNVSLSKEIPGTEFKSRKEFVIGAFLSVNLINNLNIQPEVYYLNKGVNTVELGDDETSKWKYSYIEVPILIKYQIPIKGDIKPGFFAGPYVAFNLKATQIKTENGVTHEIDLDLLREKMDYGLVLGAYLEYRAGPGKLILDVRYNMGFVNTVKDLRLLTSNVMTQDDYIKNRSITFMLGFGF